jgi:hypothetical protein
LNNSKLVKEINESEIETDEMGFNRYDNEYHKGKSEIQDEHGIFRYL